MHFARKFTPNLHLPPPQPLDQKLDLYLTYTTPWLDLKFDPRQSRVNRILLLLAIYCSPDVAGIGVFQFQWQQMIWHILKTDRAHKALEGHTQQPSGPRPAASRSES